MNLEPFFKEADGPAEGGPTSANAHTPVERVPTSPEGLPAGRLEEDEDDVFAPGVDFDTLPPPLEPAADMLPSLPPPEARASSGPKWIVLGSLLGIVAVGGYAWKLSRSSDSSAVEQPASDAAPAAASAASVPAPAPQPTSPNTPTPSALPNNAESAPTTGAEIVTTQTAWVRVIADGERVVERELPANSRIPFDAKKTIQVRTGNAGAVRLSIRGVDQGPLGRIGEVITRSFPVPAR